MQDNLHDNALRKRHTGRGIAIFDGMCTEPLCITVCDGGDAILEAIAVNLLRGVVVPENGLGIGMYQAARWSAQPGCRLALISNQPGKVCFELCDVFC